MHETKIDIFLFVWSVVLIWLLFCVKQHSHMMTSDRITPNTKFTIFIFSNYLILFFQFRSKILRFHIRLKKCFEYIVIHNVDIEVKKRRTHAKREKKDYIRLIIIWYGIAARKSNFCFLIILIRDSNATNTATIHILLLFYDIATPTNAFFSDGWIFVSTKEKQKWFTS